MMPAPAPWFFGGRSRSPKVRAPRRYNRVTPWLPAIFSGAAIYFALATFVLASLALDGTSAESPVSSLVTTGFVLYFAFVFAAAMAMVAVVTLGYFRSLVALPLIVLASGPLLWLLMLPPFSSGID